VLRSVLGATALATALALGPGGPTGAAERADPLEGLTVHPEWGSITGRPGVLRKGCRTYHYDYSTSPPEGVWTIEVHGVAVPFPVPRFAPALRQDFAVAISNADFA